MTALNDRGDPFFMEFIHDYQLIEKLHTGRGSTFYRALKADRSEPVTIELISTAQASPSEITRFKYAYEKIRQLDISGVVHTSEVFDYQDNVAIVTENFLGHPLFKCFTPGEIDIDTFLKLAGTLTRILGDIHSRGVVHQAVSPETVLCDPSPNSIKTDSVKLTGFGASGLITHSHEKIHDPFVIRNILPYMAPEQTGRMNCAMDHRADLYAAGVLFYELLTGAVPFPSDDPIEIIHAHIARQPLPPAEKNPAIPAAVSNIVMKLLAKTLGDRYQSGYGAMADFIECTRQLQKNVLIRPFGLGRHDIAVSLDVPEKLLGREKELALLTSAVDRIAKGGNEIFLVAGPPGIGKSALIFEIQKFVIAKRAYFITGKAEPYKRDIPYYPIIQAFTELSRQILCETDARVSFWKKNILQAVGANSRLIIDLVPDFEFILGPQPEIAPIGSTPAQHRISYVLKEFVKIFAMQAHPMMIFIDDLQWADAASLSFIRLLSTVPEEIGHLLIVGCYRNDEKDNILPLMRALDEAEKNGATVRDITLPPLSRETIKQLILDLLRCDESAAIEFSEIVQKRTGGNPFFIRHFLKMLSDEKILTLDSETGWTWSRPKLADIRIFDNVVDFMAAKIAGLPTATLDILKRCACFGTRFDLSAVAAIHNLSGHPVSMGATIAALAAAEAEGLIAFKGNAGEFSHDRIREGVYQLFPEAERMKTHYTIGRYLLNAAPESRLNEASIDIVNHFNMARTLITSSDERFRMAGLNRRAGEKAISSGAFESAFHYFETGIQFLEAAFAGKEDTQAFWQHDYPLALGLFNGGAEAAYLIAKYNDMYRLAEQVFLHSRSLTDTVSARIAILHALMAQNKLDEVLLSGLSVLTSLGVSFPEQPTKLHILTELLQTKIHLRGRQPDDFLNLPQLTDPAIKAQIDVMAALTSTAYWTSPNLLPLIIFRLMRTFATHGNMEYSPYIYAGYGLILCSLGEIDSGYKYGNMALTLLDRMNIPKFRSRTLMVINTFIRHWKESANNTLSPLMEACQSGAEQGDIEFAAHSVMVRGHNLYLLATPLDDLDREFQKNRETLNRLDQMSNLHVTQIYHQAVRNLQGEPTDAGALIGEIYDEAAMLPVHLKVKDRTCLSHLYFNKLILNWMFGNYAAAYELTASVMAHSEGTLSSLIHPVSFFYDSLARLSYFPQAGWFLKKRILSRVRRNQRKMKKWARHAPENFQHKYHLVEAERARIRGAWKNAIPLYKNAINGAMKAGYSQEAAISCECLAGFYLDHGMEDFAASFMAKARELYHNWGAHAKVRQLNEKYGGLFLRVPGKHILSESPDGSGPSSAPRIEDRLDIAAMMKMSQAISSEIVLEKLLVTLIRVIAENSGAEKTLLILNRNGRFEIDAEIGDNAGKVAVLQGIAVDESDALCPGIISYVKRTREPLVLDDARANGRFAGDPYVCRHSVRSILCLPLIRQQEVIGLIYLENNLTSNVFTPDRVEMITMLSTQAANCLENAIFFEKTIAAEKSAKKQREQYQKLVETMNDGMGIVDPQLHITFANNALCRMIGYSLEEITRKSVIDFLDEDNQQRLEEEVANWTDKDRHVFEIDWIAKNGGLISTILSPKPIYDDEGDFSGFLGIVTDVTDLKQAQREKELAQAQLLQSQKMEAIGMLAGGVAHDFNNYLTTILGSIDLIGLKKTLPENLKKHIAQIKNAAELSAALTRQLLAFGRRQMLEKTSINLNTIVTNIQKMLSRLIGENIQFTTRLAPDLKDINADFGQMEQIVMNLAVNARDAMPEGGHLHLKTENIIIDEAYCHQASYATPGEFVCLTVEDSGAGMSREMMDKIFDPFFSTKGPGHGTGLGLSVVYGVVKQHQGWINVYSEPNQGTTFKIYLPVSETEAYPASPDGASAKSPEAPIYQGNQERILLVEDQEEVRDVIVSALTISGYRVREAATVAEAREWIARSGNEFDLLFTDVILPDGNGIDFAEQVRDLRPAIKVLISSGYTEEKSRSDAIDRNRFSFLQKPYPLSKMFEILHQIFNKPDIQQK
ncbi:MAG: PAS domain S-box protein [Desulfobacteraceae bacterium]|nr:MAG: PAS domain S-box protein [Desulfobacteraceae bacterium]